MSEQLLQQILAELKGVKGELTEVKSEIHGLKSDVAELKSDVAVLKSDVAELKSEQQRTNRRLDQIEKDTALIPLIQQAVLETASGNEHMQNDIHMLHKNQQTVLNFQQEQQKILERLSVRSISHEADIAELRRIK